MAVAASATGYLGPGSPNGDDRPCVALHDLLARGHPLRRRGVAGLRCPAQTSSASWPWADRYCPSVEAQHAQSSPLQYLVILGAFLAYCAVISGVRILGGGSDLPSLVMSQANLMAVWVLLLILVLDIQILNGRPPYPLAMTSTSGSMRLYFRE